MPLILDHHGLHVRLWQGPSLLANFGPKADRPERKPWDMVDGFHALAGFEVPFLPEPYEATRDNTFRADLQRDMLRMVHGLHVPELWRGELWKRIPAFTTFDLRLVSRPGVQGPGRLRVFLLVKAFVPNARAATADAARTAALDRAASACRLMRAVAPRLLTLQPLEPAVTDTDLGLSDAFRHVGELRRENVLTHLDPPGDYEAFGQRLRGSEDRIWFAPGLWPISDHDLLPTCSVMAASAKPVVLSVRMQPTLRTRAEHRALLTHQAELTRVLKADPRRGYEKVKRQIDALFKRRELFWLAVQVAGDDEGAVGDVLTTLSGEQAVRKPAKGRGPTLRHPPAVVLTQHEKERQIAGFNLAHVELWPWGALDDAVREAARPEGGTLKGAPDLSTFVPPEDLKIPELFLHRDLEHRPALSRLRSLVSLPEAASAWRLPVVGPGGQAGLASRLPNPFEQLPGETPALPGTIGLGQVQHRGLSTAQEYRVPLLGRIGNQPGIGDRVTVVAGSPGSGKTNFTLNYLEQLWSGDRKVPYLVIDPTRGQEFRWLFGSAPDDLVVFTVGDGRGVPFCFNPFIVPRNVNLQAHISRMMSCFRAAYFMWDPLPAIFEDAIRLSYRRKFEQLARPWDPVNHYGTGLAEDYPNLSDVCAAMGTGQPGEEGTVLARQRQLWSADGQGTENQATIVASTSLRLQNLRDNYDAILGGAAPGRPAVDLTKLLKVPCVLELGMIGDSQALSLVMAFLVVSLAGCIENRDVAVDPLHVLVIEEAHCLLSAEVGASQEGGSSRLQAAEEINKLLAEVRKYGEGVLLLDQRPGSLVGGAIDNAYLVALHRLNERKSFEQFADMLSLSPAQRRFARIGLQPGEAVVLDRAGSVPVVLRPAEKPKRKGAYSDAWLRDQTATRVAALWLDEVAPPDSPAALLQKCRESAELRAALEKLETYLCGPEAKPERATKLAYDLAVAAGVAKDRRRELAEALVARLTSGAA